MSDILHNEELISAIDNIVSGICVFAIGDGRTIVPVYLNKGFYRMMGYSSKEMERMLKDVRRSIIPDDLPTFEQGINDILKDDGAVDFEFRTVTGDGSIRWLQVRGNLYGKQEGYPLVAGVILDVTERRSVEEELALQAERLNILSKSVREHLIDYNVRTDVMNINIDSSALKKGDIVIEKFMETNKITELVDDDNGFLLETLNAAMHTPMSDSVDFQSLFFDKDDVAHWYRATITSVRGTDGYVSRIVGRLVNIDEEKAKERELQLKADIDALTGLYNKGAATQLITDAINKCNGQEKICALIMLDLDHFKSVNDTLGHAVGDMVIQETGRLLQENFKGRDIVGRMGGDEYMIFMEDIKGIQDAEIIAQRLNVLLRRSYGDSASKVNVSASIGITLLKKPADCYEDMYKRADDALYQTKENGRDGYSVVLA